MQGNIDSLTEEYESTVAELQVDISANASDIAALTEEYNATVESINASIAAAQEDYDKKIAALGITVAANKTAIENELNAQVETLQGNIDSANAAINSLNAKLSQDISALDQKYAAHVSAINLLLQTLQDDGDDAKTRLSAIESSIANMQTDYERRIIELENMINELYEDRDNSLLSYDILPDNTYSVKVGNAKYLENIVIPEKYKGRAVTSIDNSAFENCSSLTSVTIPDSVTSIGISAFFGCISLTNVYYGGTKSDWLNIEINNNNDYLSNATIYYYSETQPDVEGNFWHYDNGEIVVIVIVHDYYQQITEPTCTEQGYTTYVCSRCGEEYVDNYVSALGHNYENGVCTRCGEPDPDYVAYFTQGLAYYLSYDEEGYVVYAKGTAEDTDIIIPAVYNDKPVKWIGTTAFYNCSSLKSITIPDSVTSIGSSAFRNCKNLISITIPDSVSSIGDQAFYICSNLTSVYYDGDIESWCNIDFADSYSNPLNNGAELYIKENGEYKLVTDLIIPDTVKEIKKYAFYNCRSLTSVTIGNGVTSIGNSAFSPCRNLTSIEIPDSVSSIGEGTFNGCSSLSSINIPDGVTSIGASAFAVCSSLTSITIPDKVTSIGEGAFSGCSSLTIIIVDPKNKKYKSENNCIIEIETSSLLIGCSNSVIPDSVTSIGNSAFNGCSGLTSIEIPDSVSSIGNYSFSGCSGLTSIEIPDGVSSIGNYSFFDCTSLTSIEIPDSVTSIGNSAFSLCSSLTSINFTGTKDEWQAISKGGSWKYKVPATFVTCTDGTVDC